MAEGLDPFIVKAVVGKLGNIVVNEAKLVLNCKEDFEWLPTQLTDISSYLQRFCETMAVGSERYIYLDAEDIVEPLYARPSPSCFSFFSQSIFRRKTRKRIKDLKERIKYTIQKAGELNLVRQVLSSNQASRNSLKVLRLLNLSSTATCTLPI